MIPGEFDRKLRAAQAAFPQLLPSTPAAPCADGRRVAIVGGGLAGMAAAFFTPARNSHHNL